jgi:hypothetical protein
MDININMICAYVVVAWLVLALVMFAALLRGVREPKSPKRPLPQKSDQAQLRGVDAFLFRQ